MFLYEMRRHVNGQPPFSKSHKKKKKNVFIILSKSLRRIESGGLN